jgi:excisionase family DNA binding protein
LPTGAPGKEPVLHEALLKTQEFDPLAYIESAFLDKNPVQEERETGVPVDLEIPAIADYLKTKEIPASPKAKFRKTEMSAPRPRRAKASKPERNIDPELQQIWESLPKSIDFLCEYYDDSVTASYYRGEFKETRQDLIRRLLDPELSLEETSRLLGVCPATVRRYTNRGWLEHHRTVGGQRRFRLSNIVQFVDEHGRFPEE